MLRFGQATASNTGYRWHAAPIILCESERRQAFRYVNRRQGAVEGRYRRVIGFDLGELFKERGGPSRRLHGV